MKQPRDHAQTLLKKAANDLIAADAILAYHDIEYPWRHDLGELLKLVIPLAPDILRWLIRCSAWRPTRSR